MKFSLANASKIRWKGWKLKSAKFKLKITPRFCMAAAESEDNSGGRDLWKLSGPTTFSGEANLKLTPGTEVTKKQQFLSIAVQTRWL